MRYVLTIIRGLPTGIYTTNDPEACYYILENSKANIVVIEDQKQLDKILEVAMIYSIVKVTDSILTRFVTSSLTRRP